MQRVNGFAGAENADEGWVIIKVKIRPSWAEALKSEALRESEQLQRRVFVADLIRDAVRAFMLIRRILPITKKRFQPSDQS